MSIHEDIPFDNNGGPVHKSLFRMLFLPLVIVLVAGLCFGIGRLSKGQGNPSVTIENDLTTANPSVSTTSPVKHTEVSPLHTDQTGSVYASSKGKRYYYENCHSTVSAANKITFATAAAAEKAGFTLAANCHP